MIELAMLLCLSLGTSSITGSPFNFNAGSYDSKLTDSVWGYGDKTDRTQISKSSSIGVETKISSTAQTSHSVIHNDDEQSSELPFDELAINDEHAKRKMDWKTICLGFSTAIAFFVMIRSVCWGIRNFLQRQMQLPVRRVPSSQRARAPLSHLISNTGRYSSRRCDVFCLGSCSRQNLMPAQSMTTPPPTIGNCSEEENESPPYSMICSSMVDKSCKSETPPPPYTPSMNQQRLNEEISVE